MKASIIIRCKDEAGFIGKVLEGVFSQDAGAPFEVVVIDSGSTDGTLDIVSRFSCEVIRISPEEFGYGYTMNLGARRSDGDILVYLSAHCPPVDSSWLEELLKPFSDPAVAGVFGKQAPRPGVNPFEEWRLERAFPGSPKRLQQYMFSSANAAVRRSDWESLPFDESLPFSEDRQWAKDATGKGRKVVYVTEAVVYHVHPFTLKGVWRRAYAAGWAKKRIYGDSCRFDSLTWASAAYLYCIASDALYFVRHGYWNYLKDIPAYRWLELGGFYSGSRDFKNGLLNGQAGYKAGNYSKF